MPVQELKDNLLKPVNNFWRNDVTDWLDAVDERFLESLEEGGWWPGVDNCLKAFAGDVCPKVVWVGESPMKRKDAQRDCPFWTGGSGPSSAITDGLMYR